MHHAPCTIHYAPAPCTIHYEPALYTMHQHHAPCTMHQHNAHLLEVPPRKTSHFHLAVCSAIMSTCIATHQPKATKTRPIRGWHDLFCSESTQYQTQLVWSVRDGGGQAQIYWSQFGLMSFLLYTFFCQFLSIIGSSVPMNDFSPLLLCTKCKYKSNLKYGAEIHKQ